MKKIIIIFLLVIGILMVDVVESISICSALWNSNISIPTVPNNFDFDIISNFSDTNKTFLWNSASGVIQPYTLNESENTWVRNTTYDATGLGGNQFSFSVNYNLTGNQTWTIIQAIQDNSINFFHWNGTWVSDGILVHPLEVAERPNILLIPNFLSNRSVMFATNSSVNPPDAFVYNFTNATDWYKNNSLNCGLPNMNQNDRVDVIYNLTGNGSWNIIASAGNTGDLWFYGQWNSSCWANVTRTIYDSHSAVSTGLKRIKFIKNIHSSFGNVSFFEPSSTATTIGKSGWSNYYDIFANSSSFNKTKPNPNTDIKLSIGAISLCDVINITFQHNISSSGNKFNLTANTSIVSSQLQNFTQNFTISNLSSSIFEIIAWIGDKSDNLFAFNVTLTINHLPNASNVSITPTPLLANTTAKGHCLYNDSIDNNAAGGNQTYWFVNRTLIPEANNSFNLSKDNVTTNSNITFSCRYNDTFDWSPWVNSTTLNVSFPILNNCTLQFTTLTNAAGNTNIFNCSADAQLNTVNSMSFDLNGTLSKTISFTFTPNSQVNVGYEIFKSLETLTVGSYSIMNVTATDSVSNKLVNSTNFNFVVTSAPSGGGGGGGGGGSGSSVTIQEVVILGNLSLILKPPLIQSNVIYAPFKHKTQRFILLVQSNKILDKCISNVFECNVKDNLITIAYNYSNDSVFYNKISGNMTFIDKANLAKTINADVKFYNIAYAIPYKLDITSTNQWIYRIDNNKVVGIRMWFITLLVTTLLSGLYLLLK